MFDLQHLLRLVPIALAIVAVLQVVYLLWLRATADHQPTSHRPTTPQMPTMPQGGVYPKTAPQRPVVLAGKISIVSGLSGVSDITLPGSTFVIGRFYHPESNVMVALDEKSISRRHAQFTGDDVLKTYSLTDLNSTYGTAIRRDGKFEALQPGQQMRVYNEDIVQFGTNVTVRLILPGDTRADATQL